MPKRFKRNSEEYITYKFEKDRKQNLLAEEGPKEFVLILDHLKTSHNIGKIFRSADAFGCRKVYVVGTKSFNSVPSKGSFKHVPAKFITKFDDAHSDLKQEGYQFYQLDPHSGESLEKVDLPQKSAFIFGHEQFGEVSDLEGFSEIKKIRIPQLGQVESLNVSIAASIVMYQYIINQPT